ncbi:MAG TPA: hypothetical protein VNS63_19565, partial [Blastocatellia bacterium]|nr:hypothetical protein [Blastocatellia bacterium]
QKNSNNSYYDSGRVWKFGGCAGADACNTGKASGDKRLSRQYRATTNSGSRKRADTDADGSGRDPANTKG